MAMASANAIAKIAMVCTFDAASGFLPMASTDFEPIQPIASAGHNGAHADRDGRSDDSYAVNIHINVIIVCS